MGSIKVKLLAAGAALALASGAWATDATPRSAGTVSDDATITASVKSKLIADQDTKAWQINVETVNGVVQLNGFVDTNTARSEAEKIAVGVSGVKQVHNNLEVRTADRTTNEVVDDAMLTGRVDAALAADKRTSALRIDVESHEGEVQLSGFAKSQAEKTAAAEIAKGVKGVRIVSNAIDVR